MEDIVISLAYLLYDSHGLGLVESGQIQEIRLLVEFVEYCAGSVFEVGGWENGNRILGKTRG